MSIERERECESNVAFVIWIGNTYFCAYLRQYWVQIELCVSIALLFFPLPFFLSFFFPISSVPHTFIWCHFVSACKISMLAIVFVFNIFCLYTSDRVRQILCDFSTVQLNFSDMNYSNFNHKCVSYICIYFITITIAYSAQYYMWLSRAHISCRLSTHIFYFLYWVCVCVWVCILWIYELNITTNRRTNQT